jgi:hypothetical protein
MWVPHAGAQEEFCARGEFEALYGGAAGPGKTDCLIALATRYIEFPDYKGILFRRTFPQLQEIIDRCWARYPSFGGVYRSTEHRWYFPSGATIALSHMQHEADMYNHQGKEYQFIGFDELTQFLLMQYLYLFSRARSTNPNIPPRIRSSTNPGGVGHNWVKERLVTITDHGKPYVDPKTGLSRIFIPGTLEDNPTLMLNDPTYVFRLEALPELEKQRLRYGIWDAFEGQVFSELSQLAHGCEPFDIPPEWERFCVFDWGYAKPFSVGWYAIDYDGYLYRYREWYGCKDGEADVGLKMIAAEVAKGILEREKGEKIRFRVADPSIWHPRPESRKGESRGPTVQEDMASQGVFFLKADNDRAQGKMQVHKRLKVEEQIDEASGEITAESSVKIFNNCKHFWRTIPVMVEDQNNPEDVDTDQEDHVYDEFRYACMARPLRPKKLQTLPSGSFAAERNKLIKAKQYAKRHGTSLQNAYTRVR